MRERLALLREYLKNRLAFGKNKKTRKAETIANRLY